MQAIKVENLSKTFRVKRKEKGMKGSIKAILHPQTQEILAAQILYLTAGFGLMFLIYRKGVRKLYVNGG